MEVLIVITWLAGKCFLAHRVFALPTISSNCDAAAGLDHRFLRVHFQHYGLHRKK